jgi:hypothetical protein
LDLSFGVNSASVTVTNSSSGLARRADDRIATHTHFTDNIGRIGLNYQFH